MEQAAQNEQSAGDASTRIMVVEDSSLVMLALEGLFDDMEWDIEGPATSLAEALTLAETTTADIALLDVNLDGESSWPVAERLQERDIPVVFATGYGRTSDVPDSLKNVPVIGKPFVITELEDLLRALVAERGQSK